MLKPKLDDFFHPLSTPSASSLRASVSQGKDLQNHGICKRQWLKNSDRCSQPTLVECTRRLGALCLFEASGTSVILFNQWLLCSSQCVLVCLEQIVWVLLGWFGRWMPDCETGRMEKCTHVTSHSKALIIRLPVFQSRVYNYWMKEKIIERP